MTSTALRHGRIQEIVTTERRTSPAPLDPAPVLGEWGNTNRGSWGFGALVLTPREGGGVDLRVTGADPLAGPHDWGEATVERLFTESPDSSLVCGYTATFALGHARTHVQANVHFGLTVFAALTSFTDGSGRASYLSRECYHRLLPPAAPVPAPPQVTATAPGAVARGDERLPMLRVPPDPAPLAARWRNAVAATTGVSEIACEVRDGELLVRAVGAGRDGPVDWGETVAAVYHDISLTGGSRAAAGPLTGAEPTFHYADTSLTDAGPAFWATFDLGFERVHLQARIHLGCLVVAMFTEFHDDSGRADYYCREVFVRQ